MRLLGVDPGLTGAVACYDTDLDALVVRDMPTAKSHQNKTNLLDAELARLIRSLAPDQAVVELVHAMPRQGVTSTFNFGVTSGVIRGVLATLGVPINYLTPQEWRRLARVPGRGGPENKGASRIRASQVFPSHAELFALVKHHNRADAALLIHAFLSRNSP